ncbi:hypothetical protein I6F35_05605 [Bradyrhizobium sp. BRP22]|uniref:hypothetical protein n=1 Tax=Bradyrhizobium sp. BRP22 TaxID=2793821 RepID=UPI001CD5A533|nr:hypothetical protein [Bradyrhizobium sp. BRP22]MCA1452694.1 hypothetical protein [Bradyrhizobium sp. BRP22]
MPPTSSSGSHLPSHGDGLLRFGEIALRFGAEAYGQWWTIASRSWGHEVDRFVRGMMSSVPLETRLRDMAGGYVNCLSELAALAPSVAEKAAMELTRRSEAGLEPYIGGGDVGPTPDGEIFEVDGKPFAMPARVLDASQGWAMYFVNTEAANRSLGSAREVLSAYDAGGGRTPLMIVGVDYRNSDFGVYPEFVVALTVTVNGDPAGQLFTYYLAIVVTQEFTKEAAHIVWGLEKVVCPKLEVRYAADNVWFGVPNKEGAALAIRFPRFGDARSSDLPTFSISQRGAGPERRTYWAMTTKSGSGEGTQIGGSVVLELGMSASGGGLCGDGNLQRLCDMLRSFDIADRLPAANGWTERQTAVYGPPRLLDLPR